jgi:hypothetical protein
MRARAFTTGELREARRLLVSIARSLDAAAPAMYAGTSALAPRARGRVVSAATRLLLDIANGHGLAGATTSETWVGASFDLEKAVRNNRIYARELGWQSRTSQIHAFLSLPPDSSEQALARAVAEFQERLALPGDGMLGPTTWCKLKPLLPPSTALVADDVRHKDIDVAAQHSLMRLSKNAALAGEARGLLSAVREGRLKGIYQEDQRVPALLAQRWGQGWWQVIPKGQDGALILDPAQPLTAAPAIVLRKGAVHSAARTDSALMKLWELVKLLPPLAAVPEFVVCSATGKAEIAAAGVALGGIFALPALFFPQLCKRGPGPIRRAAPSFPGSAVRCDVANPGAADNQSPDAFRLPDFDLILAMACNERNAKLLWRPYDGTRPVGSESLQQAISIYYLGLVDANLVSTVPGQAGRRPRIVEPGANPLDFAKSVACWQTFAKTAVSGYPQTAKLRSLPINGVLDQDWWCVMQGRGMPVNHSRRLRRAVQLRIRRASRFEVPDTISLPDGSRTLDTTPDPNSAKLSIITYPPGTVIRRPHGEAEFRQTFGELDLIPRSQPPFRNDIIGPNIRALVLDGETLVRAAVGVNALLLEIFEDVARDLKAHDLLRLVFPSRGAFVRKTKTLSGSNRRRFCTDPRPGERTTALQQADSCSGITAIDSSRPGSDSVHSWGAAIDVALAPRVDSTCLMGQKADGTCDTYPPFHRAELPNRPDARIVTIFQNHGFHWGVFFDGFTDAPHFQWVTGF